MILEIPMLVMLALQPSSTATETTIDSSSDKHTLDRFAFLPHVFIDLHRGLEVNRGHSQAGVIGDCGTRTWNCLVGTTFNIAWKKDCGPYAVGQKWSIDSRSGKPVEYRVIHKISDGSVHSPRARFIVTSSYSDDVAYTFRDGFGLDGLIQDPLTRGQLASDLQDEAFLIKIATAYDRTEENYFVSKLVGWGKIGECYPTKVPNEEDK